MTGIPTWMESREPTSMVRKFACCVRSFVTTRATRYGTCRESAKPSRPRRRAFSARASRSRATSVDRSTVCARSRSFSERERRNRPMSEKTPSTGPVMASAMARASRRTGRLRETKIVVQTMTRTASRR